MTEPNDPQAGTPGPAEKPTEPLIDWTGPVARTEPTPPSAVPPPPTPPPAPESAAPPAPPTFWEAPVQARSGPGPAPGYVYVGFWRRFVATLIDGIVFFFVYLGLAAVFLSRIDADTWRVFLNIDPDTGKSLATEAELLGAARTLFGAWLGLIAVLWLTHVIYHVVLWSWRGGTLGQLALGIQVRREADGRRIGLGTALLRYIGYLISTWALYIGLIWAAFDRRKQGWHDKIAGTVVIRRLD
jgi:uncharacterized RDD family membrane protein YckC